MNSDADPGNDITDIYVGQGLYKPDQGAGQTPLDRSASFQLLNNVALRGGFSGCGSPDPDDRDIDVDETVLTGDLIGDDGANFVNYDENAYHVVTGTGADETAVLEGFTITGGHANSPWSPGDQDPLDRKGGGVFVVTGHPTFRSCSFVDNRAAVGGGIYSAQGAGPRIVDCQFRDNVAEVGGALALRDVTSAEIIRCIFGSNAAIRLSASSGGGGAISVSGNARIAASLFDGNRARDGAGVMAGPGDLTISGCMFRDNVASVGSNGTGGAIIFSGSLLVLAHCAFNQNMAQTAGGAFYLGTGSTANIVDCVFRGNSAIVGGAGLIAPNRIPVSVQNCLFVANTVVQHGSVMTLIADASVTVANSTLFGNVSPLGVGLSAVGSLPGNLHISNSILWGGVQTILNDSESTITIAFSAVQGGWPGTGNVASDPLFVDPHGLDGLIGTADDDLRLRPGSPCIDAGSNVAVLPDAADLDENGNTDEPTPLDLADNERFADDPATPDTGEGLPPIVDMGAYEFIGALAPANVPSVSHWGLVILSLLMMTYGKILFGSTSASTPYIQPQHLKASYLHTRQARDALTRCDRQRTAGLAY